MINFDQPYFLIQRDFIFAHGCKATDKIEYSYCNLIDRIPNRYNKLKLWKNAALQDDLALNTIKDYEKKSNRKRD